MKKSFNMLPTIYRSTLTGTSSKSRRFFQQVNANCKDFYGFLKELNTTEEIVVTSYHWPDIDGIASAYALSELLTKFGHKEVKALISQTPQYEASLVMELLKIKLNTIEELYNKQNVLLVDVSDEKDIPSSISLERVTGIVDHRSYYDKNFKNAKYWIELVGSASSLISMLYQYSLCAPSENAANLLYMAIMSNTIKCKTRNTTTIDKKMKLWLEKYVSINAEFVDDIFRQKSNIKDIYIAINDDTSSKLHLINNAFTAISQLEIIEANKFITSNYESIINNLQKIKEAKNAQEIFLVIIDLNDAYTNIIFLDTLPITTNMQCLQNFVKSRLIQHNIKASTLPDSNILYIKDIYTRKEIIAKLIDTTN